MFCKLRNFVKLITRCKYNSLFSLIYGGAFIDVLEEILQIIEERLDSLRQLALLQKHIGIKVKLYDAESIKL